MNKSERLNDMMIYLNNKNHFNLKDLMEKYNISKSTALRDIQSLELIGMPIYSEYGRYGRYGLLNNKLLSPIIFKIDEMYSMYLAMLTLRSYQTTPFHLDIDKLKLKFESCISKEHIDNLKKMEKIFKFTFHQHQNSSPLLKEILVATLSNKVTNITYNKNNTKLSLTVQFFDINSSFGQWYATAYNHKSNKIQVFRCDKISNLLENKGIAPISIEKIKKTSTNIFRNETSKDFKVYVTAKGVDMFTKEHYPSMTLHYIDTSAVIEGFYNKGEEDFIASYFLSYGNNILSIDSNELKSLIVKKLEERLDYYKSI